MGEQENNEVFSYDEAIENAKSNVLERGRYRFKTIDVWKKISDAGNNLAIITWDIFDVNNLQRVGRLTKSLMTDKQQRMSFLWHNFLFSIGIRSKGAINIPKERIIGSEGFIDLGVTKNNQDATLDQNKVLNFSPLEQVTAPISDVPHAETEKPKTEKPKTKKEETEVDDEDVSDL